jgi:hypothetical protein
VGSIGEVSARAHFDSLPHIDFVLDHPVSKVWPYLLHWEEWIVDYKCEHVSGPVDAVGEKKRITYPLDQTGSSAAHYFVELVRLESERRLAYRLLPLPDEGGQPDGIDSQRGHVIFNVYRLSDEQTLVTYQTVAELESLTLGQSEFAALHGEEEASAPSRWLGEYVPVLQRLLADGR